MDKFNSIIHIWFSLYKRDLPWRSTRNPYNIWLSEIILQQTRIDQGIAYYLRFIHEFPTISDLANASEDQILKLWQGLGYYSRARNLHFTAKYIQENYDGNFPENYDSILSMKGIGEYTAAAITSISFNLESATVDGNVYRVLSRFFGIYDPIDSSAGKKSFSNLAKELIKGTDPGMHNQALMEFGALQCTPKSPDCLSCPLNENCFAFSARKINELPVKLGKIKQRHRYFNYLVIISGNTVALRKRTENDIWKNLFEFPYIETNEETSSESIINGTDFQSFHLNNQILIENISQWKIHILSHQRIYFRFFRIRLINEINMSDDIIRVNKEDIFNFAVPKLLETYLNGNSHDVLFI